MSDDANAEIKRLTEENERLLKEIKDRDDAKAKPLDMGQQVDHLKAEIKAGETAKAKLQLLQPLYDKQAKSKTEYAAKRPALVDIWQRQRCELFNDIKQLTAEQPDWLNIVRARVCTSLEAIRAEQATIARLQQELVLLKASADVVDTPIKQAERRKDDADKLQQAWLDITANLSKRLADFDTRHGKMKTSRAPLSHSANLYILLFDLLPDLIAVAPTDAPGDLETLTALRAKLPPGCTPLEVKPPPRLVCVDELSAEQDEAWQAFDAAQAALVQANQDIADKVAALEAAKTNLQTLIANLTTVPPAAAPAAAA